MEDAVQDWNNGLLVVAPLDPAAAGQFFVFTLSAARRAMEGGHEATIAQMGQLLAAGLAEEVTRAQEPARSFLTLCGRAHRVVGLVAALRAGQVAHQQQEEVRQAAQEAATQVDAATGGSLRLQAWVQQQMENR